MAAGFPQARSAGAPFRRRICQRGALSRPQPGAAARAAAVARRPEAAWRPVRLEPAWPQRRRLEPRTLRRLSRSRELAPLPVSRRVRRTDSLLPPYRPAARPAALARERLAQTRARRRAELTSTASPDCGDDFLQPRARYLIGARCGGGLQ